MKEILLTSAVLILVLAAVRKLFRGKVSQTLIYGTWLLVALRLLIPVQLFEFEYNIVDAVEPVTQVIDQISDRPVSGPSKEQIYQDIIIDYIEKDQTVFVPEVQEQIKEETAQGSVSREEILDKIQQVRPNQQILRPEVQQQVEQQVEETATMPTLGQIATAVWIAGMVIMAVWLALVNLRHGYQLRKHAQVLEEGPVQVLVSENAVSPCLTGLFRPAIYLTPESAEDPQIRRHVLAHERTHLRHGDHIWSLVRCVCLCIYWFNPLVWMAAYLSRRDCELACDEGALKRLGEQERLAYGKSLLDVVSHTASPAHLMQTATSMNETKKQLKERVNFIVKKPKISLIAAICLVLVCAIVAGCVAAGPTTGVEASVPSGGTNPSTDPTTPSTVPSSGPVASTAPTAPDDGSRIVLLTTEGGIPIVEELVWVYTDPELTNRVGAAWTDEEGVVQFQLEPGVEYYIAFSDNKPLCYYYEAYYTMTSPVTVIRLKAKLPMQLNKELALGEIMCEIDQIDRNGERFLLSEVLQAGKTCLILNADAKYWDMELLTLYQQIYMEHGDKLEILMVTERYTPQLESAISEYGITFPVVQCYRSVSQHWCHESWGFTIIDKYGMAVLKDSLRFVDAMALDAICAHFTVDQYQTKLFNDTTELIIYVDSLNSPSEEATYEVKVIDDSGNSIVGLKVELYYSRQHLYAETDEQGIARFALNRCEDVYVFLKDYGSRLDAYNFADGVPFENGQTQMTIVLQRKVIKTYTVNVVDKNGTPIEGIPILLLDSTCLYTDANGMVRWEDYEASEYSFYVASLPDGYKGVGGYAFGDDTDYTLVLRSVVDYTVRVVDEAGNPIVGREVRINGQYESKYGYTDSNGVVQFEMGEDDFEISILNWGNIEIPYLGDYAFPEGETEVTIVVKAPEEIDAT